MALSNAERQRLFRARHGASNSGQLGDTVVRAASALLMAKAEGTFADEIVQKHFSKDALLPAVIRPATSPTTTAGGGLTRLKA
jgi:hypothetical protein